MSGKKDIQNMETKMTHSKRRLGRTIIAITLCFVMIQSLCSGIFATEEKPTINYVSLGSSQTLGFGLEGFYPEQMKNWTETAKEVQDWDDNLWQAATWNTASKGAMFYPETGYSPIGTNTVVDGAFSTLVKEALEKRYTVNFSQLAGASLRTRDLCLFLGEDYIPDAYSNMYLLGEEKFTHLLTGEADIEVAIPKIQDMYQTALKNADLISYDLGVGDFSLNLMTVIFMGFDYDIATILSDEELNQYNNFRTTIWNRIIQLPAINKMDPEQLAYYQKLADNLAYFMLSYCKSFDTAMKWIFTNNDDATVVVMQIQNLLNTMNVESNGICVPAGSLVQILIDIANTYVSTLSPYAKQYYYARITDEQRVGIFIDELVEFQKHTPLSDDWKCILDVYDNFGINIKSMLTPVYEGVGGTVHDSDYDTVLDASYDAVMQVLQAAYNPELEGTTNFTTQVRKELAEYFKDLFQSLMQDISSCVKNGEDYEWAIKEAIDQIESADELTRQRFYIYIR